MWWGELLYMFIYSISGGAATINGGAATNGGDATTNGMAAKMKTVCIL